MHLAAIAPAYLAALAAVLPNRIVTRELLDATQRDDADLERGVITILTLGADSLGGMPDEDAGQVTLVTAGQLKLQESSHGDEVEDAELAMFAELRQFVLAPGMGLCPLELVSVAFSGQLETPYGWFRAELIYADID